MEGIIAFFKALPAAIALLNRLGTLLEKLVQHAEQTNFNGFMDDLEKQIDGLSSAKTQDDKFKAAQGLAAIIRGIGTR